MNRSLGPASLIALAGLAFASVSLHAMWVPDGVGICTMTGNQLNARIIPDGTGGAIMAWQDGRGSFFNVFAQRVDADGVIQWTADGVAVCPAGRSRVSPQLVSDGEGGAIITWEDSGTGNGEDIYAQRLNSSGAVMWAVGGVVVCGATGNQYAPEIVSDGAGGAVICWRAGGYTEGRAYAQRVDASGEALWTADGVRLCSTSASQWDPDLASDDAHGAIVTWYDRRSNTNYDIYAQRIDASGAVRWGAAGAAVATETHDQIYPEIACDGAGGAVIVWADLRNSNYCDVYAQRIDTLGNPMWGSGTVAVAAATGYQSAAQIIPDEAGGAVIAWNDSRGTSNDIYAQRLSVTGMAQWGGGVIVCDALLSQDIPALAPDGTGGAVIAWRDARNSDSDDDIYAQRVDGLGGTRWVTNGAGVCVQRNAQDQVQVVSDGEGGAIFVWRDYRTGASSDIYATALTEYGTGVDDRATPGASYLSQNFPNPFNPATVIAFGLGKPAVASLRIYDAAGRLVRVLVEGNRAAGQYTELWDGRDASGSAVASGVYFCRLDAGTFTQTKKAVLLR
jgi:hypothetical protein